MPKKKIYPILAIIFLACIISLAPICNLGNDLTRSSLNKENDSAGNPEENMTGSEKNDSSNKNGNSYKNDSGTDSTDSTDSASTDKDGSGNKDNKDSKNSSKSVNNPPVINSMQLNGDVFLPNQQCVFTCDVTDPDNNIITYDWHVDAGQLDTPEAASVNWTAPGNEGIYDIVLNVSDGWGGTDTMKKTVSVGGVPKNAPPVIQDIAVYPEGSIYTGNTYEIWCINTDPNNSVINFKFNVTGGILYDQDANVIIWDAPNDPGTYTVSVTVSDKEGNNVTDSKDFVVEQSRLEITDIIVQIDYIQTNASYYIKGIIIDPKSQASQILWDASGGGIHSQNGLTAVWDTPPDPGIYELTMTVNTLGGSTLTKTKEFSVNLPK